MMYLSRLILNPRSRQVRQEMADSYEMHRTISRAFGEGVFNVNRGNETCAGVLFRIDLHPQFALPALLVQSKQKPDWSFLRSSRKDYLLADTNLPLSEENPAVKTINPHFSPGQALAFRLRANPTIKKGREGKKQGRRVGLVREEDQVVWVRRKIESIGGILLSAQVSNKETMHGNFLATKLGSRPMQFLAVQFDGIVRVENPDLFLSGVEAGIGSGKGLGFGLLSLAIVSI